MDITRKEVSSYIASKVNVGRLLRNLTQVQLSKTTGISQNFISNIENGVSSIDAYDLMAIAVALDFPYQWFLPAVGKPPAHI